MALPAVHAVFNAISDALLDAEIANLVIATPRAPAFLAYTPQLADSVGFIDSAVDPGAAA